MFVQSSKSLLKFFQKGLPIRDFNQNTAHLLVEGKMVWLIAHRVNSGLEFNNLRSEIRDLLTCCLYFADHGLELFHSVHSFTSMVGLR